ncbi:tetraspanin-20-like [Magnolia sinica]|uniref:tetraspanin-20-like n=1 Tax=Magnolia sinica TaxID=86752 RepID=UPI00265A0E86|nr:tetraspanin-20-like [Magnolia sinica]
MRSRSPRLSSSSSSSSCCCWWCQSFLAFQLKFLNFLQTFIGISIIIYSVWMLDQWNRHGQIPLPPSSAPSPQGSLDLHNSAILRSDSVAVPGHVLSMRFGVEIASGFEDGIGMNFIKLPAPWFIYSFMGIGILLCLVTCTGHIAAEAVNGCCLCFYTLLMTVFIIIEAALVSDMVFNDHWDKDLPYDPTGELERLRSFIKDNIDICRWVGLAVVIIQALSLLLAMILRAMVTTRRENYDSDDDYAIVRGGSKQPLLNSIGNPNSASTSTENKGINSDTWRMRMREKYGLNLGHFAYNQ